MINIPFDRFTQIDDILRDLSNFLKTALTKKGEITVGGKKYDSCVFSINGYLPIGVSAPPDSPIILPVDLGSINVDFVLVRIYLSSLILNNVIPLYLMFRARNLSDGSVFIPYMSELLNPNPNDQWIHIPHNNSIDLYLNHSISNLKRFSFEFVKEEAASDVAINLSMEFMVAEA